MDFKLECDIKRLPNDIQQIIKRKTQSLDLINTKISALKMPNKHYGKWLSNS